jgi:hypothetical protein
MEINGWITVALPSVIVVLGGIVGWFIRSKSEEMKLAYENMREKREMIYAAMLKPFVEFLVALPIPPDKSFSDLIAQTNTRYYERKYFDLVLFVSDDVLNLFKAV